MRNPEILPSLFDSLDTASQQTVTTLITTRHLTSGTIVHLEGDSCDALEWIGSGVLKVEQIDQDGNHRLWHLKQPGEIVALPVVAASNPRYAMTITAVTSTTLHALHRDILKDLIWNHPAFAWALVEQLADTALGRIEHVKETFQLPLKDRLLRWLEQESYRQQRRTIILPMSKTLLAERFGVARTSLSRVFQQLRTDGILTFDRHRVTMLQQRKSSSREN